MRHGVDGRKLGRRTSHRLAMFKNLANSVIEQEQVITTIEKAKEARRVIDRLITLGKSGTPASRRLAFDRTRSDEVVLKLFGDLATRYAKRPGGYTRIVKLADRRRGDGAELAVLEMVDHPPIDRKKKIKSTEAEGAIDPTADTAPSDPFSKMRKLFGAGKKTEKVAGKKVEKKVARKHSSV